MMANNFFNRFFRKEEEPPIRPLEGGGGSSKGEETSPSIDQEIEKDKSADAVFKNPQILSGTTINFAVDESEGRELKPNRRLLFIIPEEFRNRIVRDVILRHRKASKYCVDIGSDGHDPYGAYSRVELHDTKNNKWRAWVDYIYRRTDKFAEPRGSGNPEHEALHDWVVAVGKIRPDAMRLTNMGKHLEYSTCNIHGLDVIFFPDFEKVDFSERIYCPGTSFVDLNNEDKFIPTYGGGEDTEGKYIGAIALNEQKKASYKLGEDLGKDAEKKDGAFYIKLQPGRTLMQVEISAGDTEYLDRVDPETKRRTRLGWAKLWIGIKRAKTGNIEWFVKNANVPPQGVIAGGPFAEQGLIQNGDELVVESRNDTAYIMGWRLAYEKND